VLAEARNAVHPDFEKVFGHKSQFLEHHGK
jgi:hypothetical protein